MSAESGTDCIEEEHETELTPSESDTELEQEADLWWKIGRLALRVLRLKKLSRLTGAVSDMGLCPKLEYLETDLLLTRDRWRSRILSLYIVGSSTEVLVVIWSN